MSTQVDGVLEQSSPTTCNQISSGYGLCSIYQCISELIFSSVSASSKSVAVRVNFDKVHFQIVDDGKGLTENILNLLDDRFPKENISLDQRGVLLKSCVELCEKVVIESRLDSQPAIRRIFLSGKAAKTEYCNRQCPGTTITLKNLFYQQPIRQKRTKREIDQSRLVEQVTAFSIGFPHISFSLRDDAACKILVQTKRTNSTVLKFQALFSHTVPQIREFLSSGCQKLKMFGGEIFICPKGHSTNSLQFVFVISRPVYDAWIRRTVDELLLVHTPKEKDYSTYSIFVLKIQCHKKYVDISDQESKVDFQEKNKFIHFLTLLVDTCFPKTTCTASRQTEAIPTISGKILSVNKGRRHALTSETVIDQFVLPEEISESLENKDHTFQSNEIILKKQEDWFNNTIAPFRHFTKARFAGKAITYDNDSFCPATLLSEDDTAPVSKIFNRTV